MVLGLLLTSCSNKVDKAIEKCADFQILSQSKTYFKLHFSSLVSNDQKYKDTIKKIDDLKKIREETNERFALEYDKWKLNNPRPKMPSYNEVQQGYTLQKYKALMKDWNYVDEEIIKALWNPWEKAKKQIEDLEELQGVIIKNYVRENLKKISLKEKSLIYRYNSSFEKCEKAQKKVPKTFMLEWSK